MPPKKKKTTKKSGKKGAKSAKVIPIEEVNIDEPELNKEFFIYHIKDLERKLRLYKEKESKLQSSNDEYLKKEKEISKEKHDLISYLKTTLSNRGDEMSDLKMRYSGLEQMKEVEKGKYDSRLQAIRTDLVDTKDRLTTQNNILSAKLEALERFKQEQDKLSNEYKDLENVKNDKIAEHEHILELIRDKQSHDRDRLKKEIVSKLNLVAAEFRKESQKQTSETTKRTIRENVSIRTQLAKMDDKNIELMQENQQMREKIRENCKKMKSLDASHTDLASKNSSHAKLLHLLTLKHQEHQEILATYQREMSIISLIQEENDKIKIEMESRKEDMDKLELSNHELTKYIDSIKQEIEMATEKTNEARAALISGVQHLKELLQSKSKGTSTTSAKSTGSNLSKLTLSVKASTMNPTELREWGDMQQRTAAAEKLQKLLDALDYENDSSRASSVDERDRRKHSQISNNPCPPSASISIAFRGSSAKRFLSPIEGERESHAKSYKILSEYEIKRQARIFSAKQRRGFCVPGALQTVPHMSRHIMTNVEKTRELAKKLNGLSASKNEDEIEKPIKFIESQPLSDAKARFLADKVSG